MSPAHQAAIAVVVSMLMITTCGETAGIPPESRVEAIERFVAAGDGAFAVAVDGTAGVARLLQAAPGSLVLTGSDAGDRSLEFFARHGWLFGVEDASSELRPVAARSDRLGWTHLSHAQQHRGLPVFGGLLRTHFDSHDELVAVNGTFVPDISLDTEAAIDSARAASTALSLAAKDTRVEAGLLDAVSTTLTVFRAGLVRGVPGKDHLAWQVEVRGEAVGELIFIDAQNGRLVDRIDLVPDLDRRVHYQVFPNPIWVEGDPQPYSGTGPFEDGEINTLIDTSAAVFELYQNLSGGTFLSWDGADGTFENLYDVQIPDFCPNASWGGSLTRYCRGTATDDVVAHEWTHAYTDSTHNLIYQWQPGALNESYSDIFGEIVDLLNGTGLDEPGPPRSAGQCSAFAPEPFPRLDVLEPESIAGGFPVGDAEFNPPPPWTVSATLELVDDGVGSTSDGCETLVGFTAGNIAVVDRSGCEYRTQGENAEAAGAAGVVVLDLPNQITTFMPGAGPALSIPSVILNDVWAAPLRAALPQGVEATMSVPGADDQSYRWLTAEESVAFGGAIRDMWNPECMAHPAKVSSPVYWCIGDFDNGGVHRNSGVSNHAFALLVDGGSFNGQTVGAIGMTRAAHVYWRAMSSYQVPTTDFADHADLLELSCQDLIGIPLTDLATGQLTQEMITASDCAQVASAMAAVEMRLEPEQCDFEPLLDPGPAPEASDQVVYSDDFASAASGWSSSNAGVYPEYVPRDWAWTGQPPAGGDGGAWFALDSVEIGDCVPGSDDQSGVMYLDSPAIRLPRNGSNPVLTFRHWVATEPAWDGGNLWVSVNGGSFTPITVADYSFNRYSGRLNPSDNPLAGQWAFHGTDGGSVSGSWGESQALLDRHAGAGDTLRIRFAFGVDGCNGAVGWYVDELELTMDIVESAADDRLEPLLDP